MEFLKFLLTKLFWKNLFYAIAGAIIVAMLLFLFLRIFTRHGQALAVPDLTGLSIEETSEMITQRKLYFKVIDSVYSSEVERGCVVEQNPPPEFKVKKYRTIFVTINAFNPEMVRVPDLVGVTLRQARSIIQNSGLSIGKLTYVPDIAINNVLQQKINGQMIAEGDSVIKGAKIDLTLGRGLSNDRTVVPELIGMYHEEARESITTRYLNLGAVIYDGSIFNEEDSANAFVWKQRPAYEESHELMNLGSSVDIWLTVDSLKLPLADTAVVVLPDEDEIFN